MHWVKIAGATCVALIYTHSAMLYSVAIFTPWSWMLHVFLKKKYILKTHHENSESNSKVTDESQPKHQGSKMDAQASSKM